jgi:hypothetical protein
LVLFVFEEEVKSGQGAVTAGHVLLHFHLLAIGQLRMSVNLLF